MPDDLEDREIKNWKPSNNRRTVLKWLAWWSLVTLLWRGCSGLFSGTEITDEEESLDPVQKAITLHETFAEFLSPTILHKLKRVGLKVIATLQSQERNIEMTIKRLERIKDDAFNVLKDIENNKKQRILCIEYLCNTHPLIKDHELYPEIMNQQKINLWKNSLEQILTPLKSWLELLTSNLERLENGINSLKKDKESTLNERAESLMRV